MKKLKGEAIRTAIRNNCLSNKGNNEIVIPLIKTVSQKMSKILINLNNNLYKQK